MAEQHIQINTGQDSPSEYARNARIHLFHLVQLSFAAVSDPDDLSREEIESLRFVLDLALKFQSEEDRLSELPEDT